MFFRQILAKEATLSYFFGCGSCHVGVVVDPVLGDEELFMAEAARQDVKITMPTITPVGVLWRK